MSCCFVVHIEELTVNGAFRLSPALTDVFLPARERDFTTFVSTTTATSSAATTSSNTAARTVAPAAERTTTTTSTGKRSG